MNCVGNFFFLFQKKKKPQNLVSFTKPNLKKDRNGMTPVRSKGYSTPGIPTPKKNKPTDSSKVEPRPSSTWTIGRLAVRHKPTTLRNL